MSPDDQPVDPPETELGRQSREQRRAAETVALDKEQLQKLREQAGTAGPAAPSAGGDSTLPPPAPAGSPAPFAGPTPGAAPVEPSTTPLGRGQLVLVAAALAVIVVLLLVVALA